MSDPATAWTRELITSKEFAMTARQAEWTRGQAEAEARAILAESEPMPEGYIAANRCYLGPITHAMGVFMVCTPAADALAEALAAFVAMEVR